MKLLGIKTGEMGCGASIKAGRTYTVVDYGGDLVDLEGDTTIWCLSKTGEPDLTDFFTEVEGSPKEIPYETPIFPEDASERKTYPMFRGLLCYFPHALAEVSHQSWKGNQQHHPDKPLHWDMSKSTDEADCLVRHLMEGDYVATAWRALALLERSLTGKLAES